MELTEFGGWPNCIRLSNRETELIVTTDVGPRIIRYGFTGAQNLLHVSDDDKGKTGGQGWRIYGGHRLWHAPEVMPRTYYPDNDPVGHQWDGYTLKLSQPVEKTTGIVKEMDISLDPWANHVSIVHRLINRTPWAIETAPWAITAHAAGSQAIFPQEPYLDPELDLLPSRPLVLWNYTRMSDKRFTWGDEYIIIRHDFGSSSEQKIGILNKQGWCAVVLGSSLMVKRFAFEAGAVYPDMGSNNEGYVNGALLETETLGPLGTIGPGSALQHREDWFILAIDPVPARMTVDYIKLNIRPVIESVLGRN